MPNRQYCQTERISVKISISFYQWHQKLHNNQTNIFIHSTAVTVQLTSKIYFNDMNTNVSSCPSPHFVHVPHKKINFLHPNVACYRGVREWFSVDSQLVTFIRRLLEITGAAAVKQTNRFLTVSWMLRMSETNVGLRKVSLGFFNRQIWNSSSCVEQKGSFYSVMPYWRVSENMK